MLEFKQSNWIENEFKNIFFGDTRLVKRFNEIMVEFTKNAQSNISSVFDKWSSIKACYRFLENKKTESNIILNAHINSTLSRINDYNSVVCIIQDTTILNYKTHHKAEDLDLFSRLPGCSFDHKGLILHNTFAVTEKGVPLGLLGQKFVERKSIKSGSKEIKKHSIHKIPVESKESYRWIELTFRTLYKNVTLLKFSMYRIQESW